MLVYLWYTLITPASVGMPVITIIYIVQTCLYLPNTKITWPSPNTRQFCWTIYETLIPPATLVIRWKRSFCANSSLFIHTHILLSPPHLHSVAIPMTRVHPTYVGVPAKLLLAQSNNLYIPCTKRSLPWYWHTCDTFICPAYVSMSVKTKLAVVQSRLYLLNINTSTLQHLLYDTSMPPCLQSKCDRYSWLYAVLARSYFWTIRLFQLG